MFATEPLLVETVPLCLAPVAHTLVAYPVDRCRRFHAWPSVKGLGPVFAAGILAETGDIHRFPDHDAVAKYAGLAWSRHQSGQYESEDKRLIHTENRYLRYYLVEAVCSLAVHDAEFGRYFQRKKAEAKTHAHLRALALTARKLVRLVDHLLRSNRLYNPLGAPRRKHLSVTECPLSAHRIWKLLWA